VDKPVDTFLEFDECSKIRDISDLSVDLRADREFNIDHVPRIVAKLLHSEADTFFLSVDTQDLDVYLFSFME